MKSVAILPLLCFLGVGIRVSAQIFQSVTQIGGIGEDQANTLHVDVSDNIYLAGYFSGTVDFDPSGSTADLTSNGDTDIFLAKYDASGNYMWAIHIGGTASDEGMDIDTDASGNVYLTGFFRGTADFDPSGATANLTSNGGSDIFVAKYSSSGAYSWAHNFGSSTLEIGYGIVLDNSDNVYVTGYFTGTVDFNPGVVSEDRTSVGDFDLFLAKYDASGSFIWANAFGSLGVETGFGLVTDGTNYVYVTGQYENSIDFDPGGGISTLTSSGGRDIFFAKYDLSGNFEWANGIGSTGFDRGFNLTVDGSGNVYVIGSFEGTADFDPSGGTQNITSNGARDAFFGKYNSSGGYEWAYNIGGTSTGDEGYSIGLDGSGNVCISGYFSSTVDFDPSGTTVNLSSNGDKDLYFAKYDNLGNYIWAAGLGGTTDDEAISIAINSSDQVVFTGFFTGTVDFDFSGSTSNLASSGDKDIYFSIYDNTVLPVIWRSFSAEKVKQGIELKWSTASESNNQNFVIDRSIDAINWFTIAELPSKGDSDFQQDYQYLDRNLGDLSTNWLYYRIKQVDFNGTFEYSRIEGVEVGIKNDFKVFPSPAFQELTVLGRNSKPVQIEALDLKGRVVLKRHLVRDRLNISSLAGGIYFFKLTQGNRTNIYKILIK